MKPTANIALVGCGRIAGHHCRSIATTPGTRLVAVCDLAADRAKAWGEEFSVPYYTGYRDMLAGHPDIDTVAVITPSGMHFEHGMEMIEQWHKNVIMEKPTFMRPDQLLTAFRKADEVGVRIYPVFQNRYNRAVARVKRAVEAGELGQVRVVAVRTRWCRPQRYYDQAPWRGTLSHDGGALTNQGIHHVDLLRYLCGPVGSVSASMRTLGAEIEAEDTVVATFTYPTGAVGSLEVTTAARPDDFEASLSIVGSKGVAQIGGIAVNELQIFTPEPAACSVESEDFSRNVYGNGHAKMYRDLVADINGERPYPVTRDDAHSTLCLLHAFYRSDERGGAFVAATDEEASTRLGRPNDVISALYRTPRTAAAAV